MREIAFKAKEIGTGDWVYGYLVRIHEDDYRIVTEDDLNYAYTGGYDYDGSMTKIDKDTICQYTGLTDKNDNKIWENDIVKGTFFGFLMPEENYVGEICWQENISGWGSNCWHSDIEVIGNIFDNPELLEGGAE